MEVILDLNKRKFSKSSVVTVGTFDGVHLGHQKILSVLVNKAKERDLQPIVVTFNPHPQEVVGIKNNKPIRILTPLEKKVTLLESNLVERILVLSFDEHLASMSYIDFVRKILLDKLHMQLMVVGHDHALGKGRQGKWKELNDLGKTDGFDLCRVEPFILEGNRVSSTLVRNSLMEGKVSETAKMLGRFYSIEGHVVEGDKRGRTMNFPTANILPDTANIRLPHFGVYAVNVFWNGKTLKGMMNIGNRPTFCCDDVTVEVNIFDFNNDIYGDLLKVEFVQWIRPEKKFSGVEELIGQLKKDEIECRKILN